MTNSPRPRGRPPGATRYSRTDADLLEKIADVVTDASPPVAPTSAMRRLGITDPSAHRRLQRKWRQAGPKLTQAVRDRRQRVVQRYSTPSGGASYGSGLGPFSGYSQSAMGMVEPPLTRLMREATEREQRIRDAIDPPAYRKLREMMERDRRLQQQMQDMIEPPGQRMMREYMEREQRMRDLIDPPHLRALRQMASGWRGF